ncbi:MAG: FAD-dependent oxidoreductase, partial [Sphingobacteriaceae bacterium]
MKNNRREFLRALGLGSGALLVDPVMARNLTESNGNASEFSAPESVFAVRELETDYLVAGGGMAGFSNALSAARNGLKVVLIQNRSRLGGNASSEIRMHICGASALGQVWRETGVLEEVMLTESYINPQRCWEMLDYVMYDKVVSNPNITLLFDTMLYDVAVKGNKIHE